MDGELAERLTRIGRDIQEAATLAAAGARPPQIDSLAAAAAFKTLADALSGDPKVLETAHKALNARQMETLRSLTAGEAFETTDEDKRFTASDWNENPFFDYVRRMYMETSKWALSLVDTAPGLSDMERKKARFFMRQALAALSPSNSLSLNPRAMNAFVGSSGATLEAGIQRFKDEMTDANGRMSPKHTPDGAFVVGRDLALSPGQIVMRNQLIELIRFTPTTDRVHERPLLIFPPWINKYYVLDLQPGRSLVEWLVGQGFTVYVASWRNGDAEIAAFDWDDYVRLGALAALDCVSEAHDAPVNGVGYCVGGTLLATLGAYLHHQKDERLASVSLLAAQIDFADPGDLGLLVDVAAIADMQQVIAENGGFMPGEAMIDAFNLLRPEDLIWKYVEESYLLGKAPDAFDVLFWNSDQTNIPGRLHLQYLRRLYLENAFSAGHFEVLGTRVSAQDVQLPAFVHAAMSDHISPLPSVYRGARALGGDVRFVISGSGHIGGVVNPPATQKYEYWTGASPSEYADAEDWIANAKSAPGSWWPVWSDWLKTRSGALMPPPEPIADAPPAPGSYVLETLEDVRGKWTVSN